MTYYHGGIAGKRAGDILIPSPPHEVDGCPICVARAAGRICRVGEYRAWAAQFGERARPIMEALAGADDMEPIDPPSAKSAVYISTHQIYARWYAARSQGDLYAVEPIGGVERSEEDPFPTWTCYRARVVRVIERRVTLTRKDRRKITKLWKRADAVAGRVGK